MSSKLRGVANRQEQIFNSTGARKKHPSLNAAAIYEQKSQTRSSQQEEKTQRAANENLTKSVQFSNNPPSLRARRISYLKKRQAAKIRTGTQSLPSSGNPSPVSSGDEASPSLKGSITPTLSRKTLQTVERESENMETQLTSLQKVESGIALGDSNIVLENLKVTAIKETEMIGLITMCASANKFILLKFIYEQVAKTYNGIHSHTVSTALAYFEERDARAVLQVAFGNLTPRDASKMLITVLKIKDESIIKQFIILAKRGSADDLPLIQIQFNTALCEAIRKENVLGLNALLSNWNYPSSLIDLQLPHPTNPEIVQSLASFATEKACKTALQTAEQKPELLKAIREGMRKNPTIAELSNIDEEPEIPVSASQAHEAHTPSPSA